MHYNLVLDVLPFVGWLLLLLGLAWSLQSFFRRKQKWSKIRLVRSLLRCPGEALRMRLGDVEAGINFSVIQLLVFPFLFYCLFLYRQTTSETEIDKAVIVALVVLLGVFLIFFALRIWRLLREHRQLSLGLDCRQAVGQELNQLMLRGCHVFHDFPGAKFNLDHVVVSSAGVYAVRTEARVKPDKGRGEADNRIFYDGTTINFPDWTETAPIEKAKQQADWLSEWLESVIGAPVSVKAVVFLPGWFIRAERRHEVSVVNEKHTKFLVNPRGGIEIDQETIKRIACQLEQRSRNVDPLAYNNSTKCFAKEI